MKITVIPKGQAFPETGRSEAVLRIDYWNDFHWVTMFDVAVYDDKGDRIELGSVKIGFAGQTVKVPTHETLQSSFEEGLAEAYFSLGQDVKYYQSLRESIPAALREDYLATLNDMVFDGANAQTASGQEVFRVSLLRDVSISAIQLPDGQFRRVLDGGTELTNYNFVFLRPQSELELKFKVFAGSRPSTNIHAIIGRNGAGKTTLLNDMICAVIQPDKTKARFYRLTRTGLEPIDPKYFSILISVAFSAFDPFNPPPEQQDPEKGTLYSYIGLKASESKDGMQLKSLSVLREECVSSISECFADQARRDRWYSAIRTLESDTNFGDMRLANLLALSGDELKARTRELVEVMSSGHAIVLMIISRLVAKIQEKTLVLLDEPESHLHPPLLSAFTRALSELLHNRNGVAIIATHSPVVLQEVPRTCASIVTRSRGAMQVDPPRIETFGENVGVLTREVFGFEVATSGFHAVLESEVAKGKSYEAIVAEYDDQIGLEAKGMLRAMVFDRDHPPEPIDEGEDTEDTES